MDYNSIRRVLISLKTKRAVEELQTPFNITRTVLSNTANVNNNCKFKWLQKNVGFAPVFSTYDAVFGYRR